jgi:DNA invertase Pin-like site-specific DNA recombinase
LVASDCDVDTSTTTGEAMANMLGTFAQFERRLIGQRAREALAVKKANGVRLGRPPTVPSAIVHRIERSELEAIRCARLPTDGVSALGRRDGHV